MEKLLLSIDQETCTGCTRCPDYSKHFYMADSGFAHVTEEGIEGDEANPQISGPDQTVDVSPADFDDVLEAAEICPGECILVELVEIVEVTS